MVVPFGYFSMRFLKAAKSCSVSEHVTVSNNPYSIPPVWRTDGASWNNKRLDFVAFALQVRAHCLENQAVVPSSKSTHILSDDPFWPHIPDDREHIRPLVAVVCRSLSSSGMAEWLAGEPSGEDGRVMAVVDPTCSPGRKLR